MTKNFVSFHILLNLGVHIGHHQDLNTTYSYYYILGIKNNRSIIDLSYTIYYLRFIMLFLKKLGSMQGHLLFYNSTIFNMPLYIRLFLIQLVSVKFQLSISDNKWKYGQLSNFYGQAIRLVKLLNIDKEMIYNFIELFQYVLFYILYKKIEGVSWNVHFFKMLKFWRFVNQFKYYNNFKHYPDAFIFMGPDNNSVAALEASSRHIPVIATIDTNSDFNECVSYPIPSNDDSYLICVFYFQLFVNSFLLGKSLKINKL